MDIELFNYNLPEELIAQTPAAVRDECRLLCIDREKKTYEYKIFIDLSADIEGSFVKENNIEFIPMEYKIGEETKTSVFVESDEVMK